MMLFSTIILKACSDNSDAFVILERSREIQANTHSFIKEVHGESYIDMGTVYSHASTSVLKEMENEQRWLMQTDRDVLGMDVHVTTFTKNDLNYTITRFPDGTEMISVATEDENNSLFIHLFDMSLITPSSVQTSSLTQLRDGYQLTFTFNAIGIDRLLEHFPLRDLSVESFDDILESDATIIIYLDENYLRRRSYLVLNFETYGFGMAASHQTYLTLDVMEIDNVSINFPDWLTEIDEVIEFPSHFNDDMRRNASILLQTAQTILSLHPSSYDQLRRDLIFSGYDLELVDWVMKAMDNETDWYEQGLLYFEWVSSLQLDSEEFRSRMEHLGFTPSQIEHTINGVFE